MLDTVRVAADTFSSMVFMGSQERKEFTRDNRPQVDKAQKRNIDGVPLWSVQIAVVNWRGTPQLLGVTIPMFDSPADKFTVGQPVRLTGLVFGVTPKRDSGFVTWCSADDMAVVQANARPAAVA